MSISTYAVILTPAGRAAVASVLVAGLDAVQLVESAFRPAGVQTLAERPIDRIVFGRWQSSATASGEGEEVVVARRASNCVEIHCHGGLAAVRGIVDTLVAGGAEEIPWDKWLHKSNPDRIAVDARIALAAASTRRAAIHLWQQHEGALRNSLLQLAKDARQQPEAVLLALDDLLAWSEVGLRLTSAWRVVLAGEPNVGKSSLLNAIVGYQRAIVHHEAGTTRDVVTATTALDGWPVELADTAGRRPAGASLEAAGIERARQQLAAADLVIVVCDRSRNWTQAAEELLSEWPEALLVANKSDLPLAGRWTNHASFAVSALAGHGLGELIDAIARRLVPRTPPIEQALPFTIAQREAIAVARDRLSAGDAAAASAALTAIC